MTSTTTQAPPDHKAWKATLAKAAARRTLAEIDFLTTVAATSETVPQTEIAVALHTSQANVSRWAARGRQQAERHPAGSLGADPYEIAQRYALGEIPRDELIAALGAWPYEEDFVPKHYWDDLGVSPEGGFRRTVGRALDEGLLSDTDYDAILHAMADQPPPAPAPAVPTEQTPTERADAHAPTEQRDASPMSTPITFHGQQLAVAAELLAAAGISDGDNVIVEATDQGVLVRRQTISDEIDAHYAAGRFQRFNSDEAFIAHLDSLADHDAG